MCLIGHCWSALGREVGLCCVGHDRTDQRWLGHSRTVLVWVTHVGHCIAGQYWAGQGKTVMGSAERAWGCMVGQGWAGQANVAQSMAGQGSFGVRQGRTGLCRAEQSIAN